MATYTQAIWVDPWEVTKPLHELSPVRHPLQTREKTTPI